MPKTSEKKLGWNAASDERCGRRRITINCDGTTAARFEAIADQCGGKLAALRELIKNTETC